MKVETVRAADVAHHFKRGDGPMTSNVGSQKKPVAPRAPVPPRPSVRLVVAESTDEAKLNKTERAWLEELRSRNCEWLGIQCMTLKLGDDCRYTPDFVTIEDGRLTAWEVKGFMRDDAMVKLKTAARNYSWIRFVVVKRTKGQWDQTEVRP